MISITQIVLLVASAALTVSAGPTTIPEAVRAIAEEASFEARGITSPNDANNLFKRNGELYCGNFATANYDNAHQLQLNQMASPGTSHTIAAHGCLRTGCLNTSGIYVCNDRDTPLTLTNGDLVSHTSNILGRCCVHNKYNQLDDSHQSGGQQFTDALGGNWNVVVAYANCNHAATQIPSSYNGGTVNGPGCLPAAMYIG